MCPRDETNAPFVAVQIFFDASLLFELDDLSYPDHMVSIVGNEAFLEHRFMPLTKHLYFASLAIFFPA